MLTFNLGVKVNFKLSLFQRYLVYRLHHLQPTQTIPTTSSLVCGNSAPSVICSLCHTKKRELLGDLGEGEQFCNSCGFVEAVSWCWLFDCLIPAPSPDCSSRQSVTGKKQPLVGRDSLASLPGQTGVFFNHRLKASGNPGLFPRSAGISLAL